MAETSFLRVSILKGTFKDEHYGTVALKVALCDDGHAKYRCDGRRYRCDGNRNRWDGRRKQCDGINISAIGDGVYVRRSMGLEYILLVR